jgi:lipoyl(octanoyl) transferase
MTKRRTNPDFLNGVPELLLLLQHPPVITLGVRSSSRSHITASDAQLASLGIDVHETGRGGDVTYHGPGQIVGYPIFDLRGYAAPDGKRKTLGAVDFLRRLEEVLIRTCADFAIATKRIQGLTGVWTNPNSLSSRGEENDARADCSLDSRDSGFAGAAPDPEEAKLAAIGIHISRFVTSHGFALNVNTDLSLFQLIIPCGLTQPVTSMQKELGESIPLDRVAESVTRNFGQVFGRQILWLESLDALLKTSGTLGVPVQTPPHIRRLHDTLSTDGKSAGDEQFLA